MEYCNLGTAKRNPGPRRFDRSEDQNLRAKIEQGRPCLPYFPKKPPRHMLRGKVLYHLHSFRIAGLL